MKIYIKYIVFFGIFLSFFSSNAQIDRDTTKYYRPENNSENSVFIREKEEINHDLHVYREELRSALHITVCGLAIMALSQALLHTERERNYGFYAGAPFILLGAVFTIDGIVYGGNNRNNNYHYGTRR